MLKQIESYIRVLKDRLMLFSDYSLDAHKEKNRDNEMEYWGMAGAIGDIIAELEGFVKVEAVLDSLMLAKLSGLGLSGEDPLYDEDGWPEPADDQMTPSTGPSLDTADGKGDYTKTEEYRSG